MLERGGGYREATYHCLPRSPHPSPAVSSPCLSYAFNLLLSVWLLHKLLIASNQRRGWVDGTRRRALISSAAALFSLFLYLRERSLALRIPLHSPLLRSAVRPSRSSRGYTRRDICTPRLLLLRVVLLRLATDKRVLSVSPPEILPVACLTFFVLVGRLH